MPIFAALPAIAGAVGIGSSIYGAVNSANAVNKSTKTQTQAIQQAEADLQPWMQGGQGALQAQMRLLGLSGSPGDQQAAIDQLKQSPIYQSLYRNGTQAILANAAATGGLRGGNTERSLYNLGTDTLSQVIQQQIANLNNVSSLGQNAAARVGNNQILGGQVAGSGITSAANANNNIANQITAGISNPQLLQALGLGGGIQTSMPGSVLAPQLSIPASSPTIGPLSTTLPDLSF